MCSIFSKMARPVFPKMEITFSFFKVIFKDFGELWNRLINKYYCNKYYCFQFVFHLVFTIKL